MSAWIPDQKKIRSDRKKTHLIGFGIIFLALNALALWLISTQTGFAKEWVLFLLYAAMSFCLAEAIPTLAGYRAAFLVVSIIACVHFGMSAGMGKWGFFWLMAAIYSSFIGGLASTAREPGLWEDNFPPTDEEKAEVLSRHQSLLGKLPPVQTGKRIFDLAVALTGILLSSPVWMLISLLIWLEDPGPLLFVKNSVGRGGENFHQFKFRSMVRNAEKETGPVLASEDDERVLKIGYVLRKTALDELPQLLNILKGEMSFVGPRPQRTVLVREYLQYMPEYAERHRVPPGISGLAQVVGSYYISPRQKLRFDRLYVRHASLGFDLKLLIIAFLLVFYLRWDKSWDGRIPRKWIRFGSRQEKYI